MNCMFLLFRYFDTQTSQLSSSVFSSLLVSFVLLLIPDCAEPFIPTSNKWTHIIMFVLYQASSVWNKLLKTISHSTSISTIKSTLKLSVLSLPLLYLNFVFHLLIHQQQSHRIALYFALCTNLVRFQLGISRWNIRIECFFLMKVSYERLVPPSLLISSQRSWNFQEVCQDNGFRLPWVFNVRMPIDKIR